MAAPSFRNRRLALLALPLLLGGCAIADTGAFARLQQEVVDLRGQVAALSARPVPPPAPPLPAVGEGEVAAIRRSHADLASSVDQLAGELRSATTRFDEGKTETARTLSRLNEETAGDRLVLHSLQAKVPALEGRVKALEERSSRGGAAAPPPKDVSRPAAQKPSEKQPSFGKPEDQYDWALGQVKRGNFKEARGAFDDFVSRNPDHKYVPNALYWKGESYYGEKDYENAIVAFQDVVDRFPDHEKAADSMLKQGLAFLALKDRENGRLLLELVVSKHPKSAAAETARKKLAELPQP